MCFDMQAFAVKILFFVFVFLRSAQSAPQVPCFFIFGDSLVDNGNNNNLNTLAKVNYRPYGIDFPQGPTGRFTNGRNTADLLAKLLGFEAYIPPFATVQGDNIILEGVNYASGSAGIRSETGEQLGDRLSLQRQLLNHGVTVSNIAELLGNDTSARLHLSQCLYHFVIGSNDYLNNYFIPEYYPTSSVYTPEAYASVLIEQYSQHLKTLYGYGARKMSVSGLGALGCIPISIARGSTNGSACVKPINDAVDLFNEKLERLVEDLNNDFADAKFVFIDAMSSTAAKLLAVGVRFFSTPCCKVSKTTGQCIEGETPCLFRDLHAFYDNFHPTAIMNKVVAASTYLEIKKLI